VIDLAALGTMTQALVSVIIPVYNTGPYIAETLDSLLNQTYPSREIIVVDDGSTDDTPRRLEAYRPWVTVIRQHNAGPGAARNAGLRMASGEYIAFLDHDDLWLPEKLEIQVSIAARIPTSGMIVCDGVHFDGSTILAERLLRGPVAAGLASSPTGEITGNFHRHFLNSCLVSCPAQTLVPRHVVQRVGPLTATRGEPSDWDYYVRIASLYPITFHRDFLVRWRYLASSVSGPLERRPLRWEIMGARMLSRHQRLCRIEDRPLITSALRTRVHQAARRAYYYGRQRDIAFARSYLARLLLLFPSHRTAITCFAALWLPEPLIRHLRGILRIIARRGSKSTSEP
jgi:glycosyltransferase involved in cell wall biosynthesis